MVGAAVDQYDLGIGVPQRAPQQSQQSRLQQCRFKNGVLNAPTIRVCSNLAARAQF
jgi:hypothetical protein